MFSTSPTDKTRVQPLHIFTPLSFATYMCYVSSCASLHFALTCDSLWTQRCQAQCSRFLLDSCVPFNSDFMAHSSDMAKALHPENEPEWEFKPDEIISSCAKPLFVLQLIRKISTRPLQLQLSFVSNVTTFFHLHRDFVANFGQVHSHWWSSCVLVQDSFFFLSVNFSRTQRET